MPSNLKSLELQGYKTFANRTLFAFADTVTMIVGPNGSGKSNIADSLRWVLGEQSYSLLRARKTEDMIFSGSENRPRSGVASATLTFDNSLGWLPIDFSEVAVTRRAYRDGRNEYLINGQRVRLRDVNELLANSGLAERTYTIIGQGLVDTALSLKVDERRRLFEEAAGIGLYRSRREESLRRLDSTQRNLERVQDILSELQPRMRSLERQARRAQEYEQVRTDMMELLREWYGYMWHKKQQQLAEAQGAAKKAEVSLEGARKEQTELETKNNHYRERIHELRENLGSWHRQLSELHAQREEISRDLAVENERARSLVIQLEGLQSESVVSTETIKLHIERVNSASLEVERFIAEKDETKSQASIAQSNLEERQAERIKLEENIQAKSEGLSTLNALSGQLQARIAEQEGQVERLIQQSLSMNQTIEQTRNERDEAEEICSSLDQEINESKRQLLEKQSQLKILLKDIEEVEDNHKITSEQRIKLESEVVKVGAEIDVIEQAELNLSGYSKGAQVLIKAAKEKSFHGIHGALNQFIEVPRKFEKAIAAALSIYIDAILLDNDPDSALDLLQKEPGQGALIPLESLNIDIPKTMDYEGDTGILGIASNLVKTPKPYKSALNLLLGDVVVVKDRQAAKRALFKLKLGSRAVNLNGEVFYATGLISTSGGDRAEGMTILSRSRRLRELTEQRKQTQLRITENNKILDDLDRTREIQAREQRNLNDDQGIVRQKLNRTQDNLQQARIRFESSERRLEWYADQLNQVKTDLLKSDEEISALTVKMNEIENEKISVRQIIGQYHQKLYELSLDEYQSQVAHWNTRYAVAEQAYLDSITLLNEQKMVSKRMQESLVLLQSRITELKRSIEEISNQRELNQQIEKDVGNQINDLSTLIEPAEMELQRVEKEFGEVENAESGARQSVIRSEHFNAQARIELARYQDSMQSLRRRIEDDFGLVSYEYEEQISGPTPLPFEGLVEKLPIVRKISPEIEESIKSYRAQLRRIGAVNPEAQEEYVEVSQRFEFLTDQVKDLKKAEQNIREVINELDTLMEREFLRTFEVAANEFRAIFSRLFGGGSARLTLTTPDDISSTGIDIEAKLPGRRTQGLSLLSGGERSLTATALIFALLKTSPTPFCVLDEVDAMLDEVNVGRFGELLRELSQNTQFVVVTHNRHTVQLADIIYGVSMGRDSVSQVLSLKLDEIDQIIE